MADIDLKTKTPGSAAASSVIIGATSTAASEPSLFTTTGSGSVALTAGTLDVTTGKTLAASNTLTLAGTDSTTFTFPSASGTVATLNAANLFTKANTFQPDSDAQAGTFRRNSSGQTANVLEIQTEANAFLAAFDKTGALTIGAASGNTGALKLKGTTSGTVTLSTADAAGTWTMKLPTSGGTNGYVLSTDGSGNTSWVAQSGGGGTPGGSDTQVQFNNSGAFGGSSGLTWNDTTKLLTVTGLGTGGGANTGGLTVSGGAMTLSGNISANAWTTSGIRYKSVAATLTDLTSSGTVAAAYTNVYGGNTIAASSATTFTDYFTTFITQPTAGTNVTFTNRWALGLSGGLNISGGTLNGTVLDISQTWGGTGTYTGLRYNVTDSGPSNAASLLLDLRVGGSSRFSLNKSGEGTFAGRITASSGIWLGTGGVRLGDTQFSFGGYIPLLFYTGGAFSAVGAALTPILGGFQLGQADVSSGAVAQTLQVQSNTGAANGPDFTIKGSNSGAANDGGSIVFQTATGGAFGTALFLRADKVAVFGSSTSSAHNIQLRQSSLGISHANSGGNSAVRVSGDRTGSGGGSRITSSSNGEVAWNSATDLTSGSVDLILARDAANTLALRNSTNAQTFRVYNGADTTNFQRLVLSAGVTSNMAVVAADNGGTGVAMGLQFGIAKTTGGGVTSVGMFTTVSGASLFVLGDSPAATSSFPALKRSSATLAVRLADDSADAALSCGTTTASATALNVTGTGAASIMSVTNTTTGTLLSVVNSSSATIFSVNDTVTTGTQVLGTSFGLSGNISAAAWTTSGIRYRNVAATLTDTSSSGTVATAYTDVFGGNTIAASSSTTFTTYATMRISAAAAGTNVTLTNAYALSLGGSLIIDDAYNVAVGTSTGTKIGTATSQKLGFWNATPIVQPTTGVTAATFTANSGTAVNDASTFDGYTIGQVVKALRNAGLLA